jgi:hypothetical protein
MSNRQRQCGWTRTIAFLGLLTLLSLWTVSVAHTHSAAKQSGVRQECQLCIAGNTSQPLAADTPVVAALPPVFFSLTILRVQSYAGRRERACPPRSPPSFW